VVTTTTPTGVTGYVTVAKKGASTGIYTFTFVDTWQFMLYANMVPVKAAGTLDMKVDQNSNTNFGTSTAPTIDMQVKKSSDGTALDPASISFNCMFVVRNSTVGP